MSLPWIFPMITAITLLVATVQGFVIPTSSVDLSLHQNEILESQSSFSKSIAEVDNQERDGSEREDKFSTSTCSHNTFLLFGNVHYHISEDWRTPRLLELYVEIGHQIWRQPLQSPFYAFQVPVQRFSNIVGLFCLQPLNDLRCLRSLWRRFFLVQDAGGQQLDIEIETVIHGKPISGDPQPVAVFPMATVLNLHGYGFLSCPARQDKICPASIPSGILPSRPPQRQADSSVPWLFTAHEQNVITKAQYRQLPVTNIDYVWDFQSLTCGDIFCKLDADDEYRWQLVSILPTVRTWHMVIYGIIFTLIQYLNSFLRRVEYSDNQTPTSFSAAIQRTARSVPNQNGTGGSEQSSAWQHTHEAGGPWSRDSAGRLTRHLSPVENCDDSCN